MHDVAVVGGGIAGLAVAELFQRHGMATLLVEREPALAGATSAEHHEWFHFGSLYSVMPSSRYLGALLDNVQVLLDLYAGFPGMNIGLDGHGRVVFGQDDGAWFVDDPINYVVAAPNDPGFRRQPGEAATAGLRRRLLGLGWNLQIKRFICQHNRFYRYDWRRRRAGREIPTWSLHDYARANIHKWRNADVRLDPDQHFLIRGYDRPMDSRRIVGDLAAAFLAAGGDLRLGTACRRHRRDSDHVRLEFDDGSEAAARRVVLATGSASPDGLPPDARPARVASPLLVAWPAVADENIVRLSPFVEQTICHVRHTIDGQSYSLIGGGFGLPADDVAGRAAMARHLADWSAEVFPRMAGTRLSEVYFGIKAEARTAGGRRNYRYSIADLGDGV